MAEFVLTYFPIKGRAEADRIILELAGANYKEESIPIAKWSEMKKKLLASDELPYGQIPTLKHKGHLMSQSMTILRYLGRMYFHVFIIIRFNYYGDNDDEKTTIDMYVDGALDLREAFFKVMFAPLATKPQIEKDFLEQTLPAFMGYFENLKLKNPGNFFVGKRLSIADIAIFDSLTSVDLMRKGIVRKNETLKNFLEAFESQPKYAEYRNSKKYHTS